MQSLTLSYTALSGVFARPRPHLTLNLTGPTGMSGDILGVIDSGADNTCLPHSYAELLGYTDEQLMPATVMGPGGSFGAYRALTPCRAYALGILDVAFEIHPSFLPDANVAFWGRRDFFRAFGVCFDEPNEEFTLTWA